MPVPKNKPITVPPERSTPDPASPILPDPGNFVSIYVVWP